MSNHAGSYLLNEVIGTLHRYGVFESLGLVKSQEMVLSIVKRASGYYDCNPGEILEEHEELLKICSYCVQAAVDFKDGICKKCRDQMEKGAFESIS